MIDSRDQMLRGLRAGLQCPASRVGFDYWNRIRESRALPLRSKFDPFDIPAILPSVILLQVMRPDIDFLYRIVGSRWVDYFSRDDTRCLMSTIEHQKPPSMIWDANSRVVETRMPLVPDLPYVGARAKYREIECCLMPLSDRGEQVDYIFVTVDFRDV